MFLTRTKTAHFVLIVMLALMVLFLISCDSPDNKQAEQALLATVKQYNSLLRLAYLEVNLGYMAPISTQKHMSRLFPVFQRLRDEDSYMRAEQESFKVERVRLVSRDKGQVDTKEKWVFWWQDHKTNRITKPKKEVYYHMRYNLVLQDGTWKVNKLEDLDLKK